MKLPFFRKRVLTLENVHELQQQIAGQTRDNWIRLRSGLVAALSDDHRIRVSAAMAEYFLTQLPRQADLLAQIDCILSDDERNGVAAALTEYFEEAHRLAAPLLSKIGAGAAASDAPSRASPANASKILAGWLPMPLPPTAPPELPETVSPWQKHGVNDEVIRRRMRYQTIAALSDETRAQVALVLASYLTSIEEESDFATRVGAMLLPNERDQVVGAFTEFAIAQDARSSADAWVKALGIGMIFWLALRWSV